MRMLKQEKVLTMEKHPIISSTMLQPTRVEHGSDKLRIYRNTTTYDFHSNLWCELNVDEQFECSNAKD